jgi:hypothetical protein
VLGAAGDKCMVKALSALIILLASSFQASGDEDKLIIAIEPEDAELIRKHFEVERENRQKRIEAGIEEQATGSNKLLHTGDPCNMISLPVCPSNSHF